MPKARAEPPELVVGPSPRRWATVLLLTLVLSVLAACMHRPNTAVSEQGAATVQTNPVSNTTPVVDLMHQLGLAPLDPDHAPSLLEQAEQRLAQSDPAGRYHGVTYDLTRGNELEKDWLIQSPGRWGVPGAGVPSLRLDCTNCSSDYRLPSCRVDSDCGGQGLRCGSLAALQSRPGQSRQKVCQGAADFLVDRWFRLVRGARVTVDLTFLQPAPDYRFLAALRDAITLLAHSGRAVTIRALIGQYPPSETDAEAFLGQLVRDAKGIRGSRISVFVSAMRTCTGTPGCSSFSWNHSKIAAVDGRHALVGGHNLWSEDYLAADPVSDLSLELEGPAARDADQFADRLWQFVCANANKGGPVTLFSYRAAAAPPGTDCPARLSQPISPGGHLFGGVPVLAVGRLASGITTDFANQSELARDLLLGAGRRVIRIAQQDLAFAVTAVPGALYPESTLERLADFLIGGGDTYIVVSNVGSRGATGLPYSNEVPLSDLAEKIRAVAAGRTKLDAGALSELLCAHLHLAPFRTGPDATWPDGHPIATHAKFWMVDDQIFYIGSDNMYPIDLQEFGYILDDHDAAARVLRDYWNPLWQWSSRAAISGSEAAKCIYTKTPAG